MDNPYKYVDQSLTTKMAQELIIELFKGETVAKTKMVGDVDKVHVDRGGKKAETKVHPVTNALNALKRKGLANNDPPGIGDWRIIDNDRPIVEDGVKWIGSGNNSVYLYYYPNYKKCAELQEKENWPCKIGHTEYSDPIHRIYEQTGPGMPEQPEVALVIRTNQPKALERAIHKLLDRDRVSGAPGVECFVTNPSRVEALYNIIIRDY